MIQLSPTEKSLVEETLGLLTDFVLELRPLSGRLADRLKNGGRIDARKLIDGLQVTYEGVRQIQDSLRVPHEHPSKALETELVEVLRKLLSAVEARDLERQISILSGDLPDHLGRWQNTGLPALGATLGISGAPSDQSQGSGSPSAP